MSIALMPCSASDVEWAESVFAQGGIPRAPSSGGAKRVLMLSPHGHWGDPPPAGRVDTGGQTLFVLQLGKEWARTGTEVLIVVRGFGGAPSVERVIENLWLIRVPAGGDGFLRKEELHPLLPRMSEAATAVAQLFGAHHVVGHYADGMAMAAEVACRLDIPFTAVPHSLAISKMEGMQRDQKAPETWLEGRYNFYQREQLELASLKSADRVICTAPSQQETLQGWLGPDVPARVISPGVGKEFEDAFYQSPREEVPRQFGLCPERYWISATRLSDAKNLPGTVDLYARTKALAAGKLEDIPLVLVAGAAEAEEEEEKELLEALDAQVRTLGLSEKNVRRIPAQPWPVLAQLFRQCQFAVSLPFFEPFGMTVAEAMMTGAPTIVSNRAGIAQSLESSSALVVDPMDLQTAASQLVSLLENPKERAAMGQAGHSKVREAFSWESTASSLLQALPESVASRERGFHRLVPAWRGDVPHISARHVEVARSLVARVKEAEELSRKKEKRLTVVLSGESGAGKTEVGACLRLLLRAQDLPAVVLPGDVFFRRAPWVNYQERLKADAEGRLEAYLGSPEEIDLEGLDRILLKAADTRVDLVHVPSDCRRLPGRKYPQVPLDLTGARILLVDFTYGAFTENADLRIYLEADEFRRAELLRLRATKRDPDENPLFVGRVLEIEHRKVSPSRMRTDLVVKV
jgi:glycosyltransferase involved in cell wall biosynthesis/uridine kinase